MMEDQLYYNILYSCAAEQKRALNQIVVEHALSCTLSGEVHFYTRSGIKIFGPGTMGLIRRNQLARAVKFPSPAGEPFKAISVLLDQESLRHYANQNNIPPQGPYKGESMLFLSQDPFVKGYFNSLLPYFEHPEQLTQGMASIKTKEAIELLLRLGPDLKGFLFDLGEPHKIDLEAFMNQHFIFNVPVSQFARLTGRSLASFKRDFQKTFGMAPQRWLLEKRLEQSHYLITEKKQNPSSVYLDVGLENLSHFSFAFKKFFGYNPSSL